MIKHDSGIHLKSSLLFPVVESLLNGLPVRDPFPMFTAYDPIQLGEYPAWVPDWERAEGWSPELIRDLDEFSRRKGIPILGLNGCIHDRVVESVSVGAEGWARLIEWVNFRQRYNPLIEGTEPVSQFLSDHTARWISSSQQSLPLIWKELRESALFFAFSDFPLVESDIDQVTIQTQFLGFNLLII